jgi:hypothetical protein
LAGVFGAAGMSLQGEDLHFFSKQSIAKSWNWIVHDKDGMAAGVLPRLSQGEAAHDMARSHLKVGVGAN